MLRFRLLLWTLPALLASPATAQQIPGFSVSKQFKLERLGENHWRATGQVEMERDNLWFFADVVDFYPDTNRMEARGNVVFTSPDSRISADRAEFNTQTRTGTFYNATGSASLGDRVDRSMFGTQEPDAYFYGEKIEKLGRVKYRITRGAFTTCLQPTPRWEVVASSATVTLEEYAILKNSVLKVKGVPLFYLPIFYYPVQDDDRATGFLIPTFGSSTIRGASLSNAFFWAIGRSHDATFFHDWFSKTGQGLGAEYRYVVSPGSDGQIRTYWLDESATTYESSGGVVEQPARQSYEIRGFMQQVLPANLRARANVDYFSDITVQQTYHTNLYDASRRQRIIGANLAGAWGRDRVSVTANRSEVFYGAEDSQVYGGMPRITYDRAQQRIGETPLYFGFGSEYVDILRSATFSGAEFDTGLTRFDVRPVLAAPFSRWPFLSVTGAAAWHTTWYSESLDARGLQIDEPLTRNYWDVRADVVGPSVAKVWDTPGNGYAEKFKHIIEPTFSAMRTSLIENYDQIVKLDAPDYTYGGTTRLTYGLTNRFLARRRQTRQPREFASVAISQSYYSDEQASQFDPSYGTSFTGRPPSKYSPIAVGARVSPTDDINGSLRLEYDYQQKLMQTIRASGTYARSDALQVTGGWSQRKLNYIDFDQLRIDNFFNVGTVLKGFNGRVGGAYNFDYDLGRDTLLQQRLLVYYNAQCCGITAEFQRYNYPQFDPRFPIASDQRFNISFTLAGIGTFSNLLGAFGGATTGRSY